MACNAEAALAGHSGMGDDLGNSQACITIVETKPTKSEGTKKSQMAFGYHMRKCNRIVGPTKMLQVDNCHGDVPSHWGGFISVPTLQGLGTGGERCIDCGREKPFCYYFSFP